MSETTTGGIITGNWFSFFYEKTGKKIFCNTVSLPTDYLEMADSLH